MGIEKLKFDMLCVLKHFNLMKDDERNCWHVVVIPQNLQLWNERG